MAIWRRTIKAGNTIEVREGIKSDRRGAPGKGRRLRTRPTSEQQEKINRARQLERATVLINANFGWGDIHLTLDYRPDARPGDRKTAEKNLNNFIRRLNYWADKEELQIKRFSVTEVGKRGALHHHLILTGGIPNEKLMELWPFGRIHVTPLEKNGDYKKLAEYLIKKTDWEFENVEAMKGKRRYNTSQNLVRPEPKTRDLKQKRVNMNPKPWKGYYIPKESIYCSLDPYTGSEYLTYRMVKIIPEFEYRKKYRKYRRKRLCI